MRGRAGCSLASADAETGEDDFSARSLWCVAAADVVAEGGVPAGTSAPATYCTTKPKVALPPAFVPPDDRQLGEFAGDAPAAARPAGVEVGSAMHQMPSHFANR